jgi:hypothetical protein
VYHLHVIQSDRPLSAELNIWKMKTIQRLRAHWHCEDMVKKYYTEDQVRQAIGMSRSTNTENVIGTGLKLHTY